MSFSLKFDESRILVTVAATGDAGNASRLEALSAVRMHPQFQSDCRILCDFLDSKEAPIRADCLDLGLTLSAYFRGQKIALVVNETEFAKLREGVTVFNTGRVEINVFNDLRSAMSWLLSEREAIAA